MRTGRLRRRERRVARYAWPAGVGTAAAAWYAADSLRHRRESGLSAPPRGRAREAVTKYARRGL